MCRSFARSALVVLTLLLSTVSSSGAVSTPPDETVIPVTTPGGTVILAELADTAEKRARGLMFRESLPKDRGMLFTFSEPQQWTFWMKNTRISLDIIWMDAKKKIVHVERNVPTCSRTDDGCPQYQSNDHAMSC